MKCLDEFLLEDLKKILEERKISLNHKNRIYLISLKNNFYLTKFHQNDEKERVNDALNLQYIANKEGFPCNIPLKNNSGFFTQGYGKGFITGYEYLPGEQLNPKLLWSKEVISFIDNFFEFQKTYSGPKINYCKRGLKEFINNPLFKEISFYDTHRKSIEYLSTLDKEIWEGNTIIHGDILSKNIIKLSKGPMILIDFEKVMRSTLTEEVASSIIYSFMGTSLSLEGVYNNFNPYIKNKLNINALNLKRAVVRKSAEYLIHRKINCFLGNSKECEVAKAEGFFSEAIKLLDTPKGKG